MSDLANLAAKITVNREPRSKRLMTEIYHVLLREGLMDGEKLGAGDYFDIIEELDGIASKHFDGFVSDVENHEPPLRPTQEKALREMNNEPPTDWS